MQATGPTNSGSAGNTNFNMKKNLLSLLGAIITLSSVAQTPGSIAFVAYQTNAPDGFAFVTLAEFPALTQISFTDNGWDGTGLFDNEEMLTWTSPAVALAPGAVVYIYDDNIANSSSPFSGPGTVTGELPNLSSSGDQILAFTGTTSNPVFIAAITSSDWLSGCATVTANSNATCLPSPLINGQTAQSPVNSSTVTSNMFFNQTNISGTPAQILAAIQNPANWTISNSITVAGAIVWPDWNVSVTPPAPSVVNISPGVLTLIEGAISQSVNVTFSTPVFGTQTLSLTLSGALQPGDLISSPLFSGASIPVNIPSGSTSITIDIAGATDGTFEGSETGTIVISNLTSGIVAGSNSSLSLSVEEPNGVSLVQFDASSMVVTEGEAALDLTFSIQPAALQDGSFTVMVTNGTMISDSDYLLNPAGNGGVVTMEVLAGATSSSILLTVQDDLLPEGFEVLTFSLISAEGGLLLGGNSEIEVAIADDDAGLIPQDLFINEVMSTNTHSAGNAESDSSDWIELFNAGAFPVNLAGLYISDDEANSFKYMFPEGSAETIIPAGGFKIIWADENTGAGPLHLNFRISSAGEYIGLYAASTETVLIDSVTSPLLESDQSWGRIADGIGSWMLFNDGFSTPGVSNLQSGIEENSKGVISVYPNPAINHLMIGNSGNRIIEFELFDTSGKLLKAGKVGGNSVEEISVLDLTPGIYFVKLTSINQNVVSRICVLK